MSGKEPQIDLYGSVYLNSRTFMARGLCWVGMGVLLCLCAGWAIFFCPSVSLHKSESLENVQGTKTTFPAVVIHSLVCILWHVVDMLHWLNHGLINFIWGMGFWAYADKRRPQSPFTGNIFLRWRHFAFPTMSSFYGLNRVNSLSWPLRDCSWTHYPVYGNWIRHYAPLPG